MWEINKKFLKEQTEKPITPETISANYFAKFHRKIA